MTDDNRKPIGSAIDASGLTSSLPDDSLITGVIVLIRFVDDDGNDTLHQVSSPGTNWLVRRGMLESALDEERDQMSHYPRRFR